MNNNIQDFFNNQEDQEQAQQDREQQQKQLGAETIEPVSSIKKQIKDIQKYVAKNKNKSTFTTDIGTEFPIFKERYPVLFKLLSQNNCDPQQLAMLLGRLEQVQAGTKSQYDASVEVGTMLVDKHVKPKLAEKERRNRNNDLH
jgi:hypothetical protein